MSTELAYTDPTSTDPRCPLCNRQLHFRAHIAAPGFGQSWDCGHGHAWIRIGDDLHDPRDEAHILRPEDVR